MFGCDAIAGIETLRTVLPDDMQAWYKFGHILELHFQECFDEAAFRTTHCMELLLTDYREQYKIRMTLFNVKGQVSFDIVNGFFSGLTIDDCFELGYEKESRFRLSSFEMDIDFTIYCERIAVELVP